MLCTHCGQKEATLHYQQNKNGHKSEMHLCADCAKEMGLLGSDMLFSGGFNFNGLLNQLLGTPVTAAPSAGAVCDKCGERIDEFRSTGFLGCDRCYDVFADAVESMLTRIQPDTTHRGRVSGEEGEKFRRTNRLKELKEQLQKAILEEKYEQAAQLRDQIRAIQNEGGEVDG